MFNGIQRSSDITRDELIYYLGRYLYTQHEMFDFDNAGESDAMRDAEVVVDNIDNDKNTAMTCGRIYTGFVVTEDNNIRIMNMVSCGTSLIKVIDDCYDLFEEPWINSCVIKVYDFDGCFVKVEIFEKNEICNGYIEFVEFFNHMLGEA